MNKSIYAIGAGAAALTLSACASGPQDPGINDYQQDEFRVVTKAPLTVPPDYSLRPPTPGVARPLELGTDDRVVTAFGTTIGQNASAGELALVAVAGANAVNPVIRNQVDFEETNTLRKSTSFSDRVLFWNRDDDEAQAVIESDSATGGEEVTIEGGSGSRIKLPGT
ncbi:MAG: DUF3035 domain-containing protein [Pseudomonadota bacterium]